MARFPHSLLTVFERKFSLDGLGNWANQSQVRPTRLCPVESLSCRQRAHPYMFLQDMHRLCSSSTTGRRPASSARSTAPPPIELGPRPSPTPRLRACPFPTSLPHGLVPPHVLPQVLCRVSWKNILGKIVELTQNVLYRVLHSAKGGLYRVSHSAKGGLHYAARF